MTERSFKFRLYPNTIQQNTLQNSLTACRWLYNKFIEQARNGFVSRNDLNYYLTELKLQESWLRQYYSKTLQMVSTQVDAAQKSLTRLRKNGHKTGALKFARFDDYLTFTYNQKGFKIVTQDGRNYLYLSKIGMIRIILHQQISGKISQVVISKSNTGKWFACVTCCINKTSLPRIDFKKAVGIDVGIKNFTYDSNGSAIPNPLNLKRMLKPLARIQRKICRRRKDSINRKKAIRFYQIIHERIKNRRKDFMHQLSTQYAKKYDVVFVERLQKLNMIKNHKLARNIIDSGWGTFVRMLYYKCMLVEVPARNTTVDCSRCGNAVPKSLAVRIHRCDVCGLVLDRDHNAAINILKNGLDIFNIKLPQELREVTPVEISKESMKQETNGIYH